MITLRSTRSFVLAASLAAAPAIGAATDVDLSPRFNPPRSGTTVDESFVVELPRRIEMPCVAIDGGNARILVSRSLLEALASRSAPGARWKSEEERLAMIRGDRASALLGAASPAAGECAQRVDERRLSNDARYLVLALLESANAMVIDARGGRVVEKIRVAYKAEGRAGGFITIYLDRGTILMVLDWWVS